MKLIQDWRRAWRMFSMQAFALLALLPVVWSELPPEAQDIVPAEYRPWVLLAVALGGMAGRVIDQGGGK